MRSALAGKLAVQLITYILAFLFLIPFVLFFLNTFKDKDHLFEIFYMPNLLNWDNYIRMFQNSNFFASIGLTITICFFTLLFIVVLSSMAGYMIGRSRRKPIRMIYYLFAGGIIIPTQMSMIPVYKIGVATHLINTMPFLIILYVAGGSVFASLFYAGFIKSIPEALEESAFIDGCGRFETFVKIIFPLMAPASATIVTTTIYWYWNDFSGPLIYLNSSEVSTLMMTIYKFMGTNNTVDWGPVYALCMVSALPMILFFLFTQNFLLKGLVVGSVKG
ncbi:carbohydrate ABC transporter permease [Cohnella silvisoli]|uniref:Carbohydrate ABC transporter permease n=1 Tax=Cohnella silvisoli TaxID=2873699 RepID=A0ABV1KT19_9BACL|nr:carbohydrate ABC transporter permease [Cohnella silvisoli]MCD9021506.1 carbohydrate ABC transporter permease [Cohnella silvisoli]